MENNKIIRMAINEQKTHTINLLAQYPKIKHPKYPDFNLLANILKYI